MGYQESLEAAGAKVMAFESFGSYQGDWWAMVTYDGKVGWVTGSFGSCSHCDAFKGEFGYSSPHCQDHQWKAATEDCAKCREAADNYRTRLASFGKSYLDDLISQEEAEASAGKNIEWDSDAVEMLAWIKSKGVRGEGQS